MNQIRVHLELAADLPDVPADHHQLQQVFLNLINNAVDAILETGAEGDLWVRSSADGNQAFVEFQDSGPGVKDPSRVFDPFYTTKPVGKGTGLGLSICYGIISEHGGTIQVRNGPERGATFRIELPIRAKVISRQGAPTQPTRAAKNGRILVVDANESVRETIAHLLAESEHHVTTATSLDEARHLLSRGEYDLVLADWQMVARGVRHNVPLPNGADPYGLGARILWMSSVSEEAAGSTRTLPAGAALLQKPFQPGELLAAVDANLLRLTAPIVRE
jgi:two-component system NtrC family sensor kinase